MYRSARRIPGTLSPADFWRSRSRVFSIPHQDRQLRYARAVSRAFAQENFQGRVSARNPINKYSKNMGENKKTHPQNFPRLDRRKPFKIDILLREGGAKTRCIFVRASLRDAGHFLVK
jgi:hypothetical protein